MTEKGMAVADSFESLGTLETFFYFADELFRESYPAMTTTLTLDKATAFDWRVKIVVKIIGIVREFTKLIFITIDFHPASS